MVGIALPFSDVLRAGERAIGFAQHDHLVPVGLRAEVHVITTHAVHKDDVHAKIGIVGNTGHPQTRGQRPAVRLSSRNLGRR